MRERGKEVGGRGFTVELTKKKSRVMKYSNPAQQQEKATSHPAKAPELFTDLFK